MPGDRDGSWRRQGGSGRALRLIGCHRPEAGRAQAIAAIRGRHWRAHRLVHAPAAAVASAAAAIERLAALCAGEAALLQTDFRRGRHACNINQFVRVEKRVRQPRAKSSANLDRAKARCA